MKITLILILALFIYSCNRNSSSRFSDAEKTIEVLDEQDYFTKKLEFHHDREVKIYTLQLPDDNNKPYYGIYVYRSKGGAQPINYMFEGPANFTKATYRWINDSTFNFKMYNEDNNLTAHYTYITGKKFFYLKTDSIFNNRVGAVHRGPIKRP